MSLPPIPGRSTRRPTVMATGRRRGRGFARTTLRLSPRTAGIAITQPPGCSEVHGLRKTANTEVPFTDLGAMTREVRADVVQAWSGVLDTSGFIGGAAVDRFEAEWAEYCGTSQCIGVANGTDALQLTLMAFGIGLGDEGIVPANTFVATA